MDSYTEQFCNLGFASLEEGDEEAALRYFEQAAGQGNPLAQFQIGLLYENGALPGGKDEEKALKYYLQAAEQNYAPAQFNLGYLYCQMPGRGEDGLALIRLAAQNGDEAAAEYMQTVSRMEEEKQLKEKENRRIQANLKTLIAKKELFVLFSSVTNHPYLAESDDLSMKEAFVYTSGKTSGDEAAALSDKGYAASSVRITQKGFLSFFSELYTLGVNALRVRDGRESYEALLAGLVKRKDLSEVPQEKRPVENPALQFSMLLYMQELRSRAENPDAARRKRLDSTMVSCLLDARYLLPHKNTQLLLLSNSSTGKKLIPLFTDLIEFSRFSSRFSGGKDLKLVTADFAGLSKMELPGEADGFLINPSTSAVPLPADYIRKLSQRIEDVRKELNNKTKI